MDNTKIRRTFSEPFKRQKVAELESCKTTISEIASVYGVTKSAIHKWIKKYSFSYTPQIKMVVEMASETQKTEQLIKKVAELERVIGVKQLEIDFLNTLVKVSSEELSIDLRKVFFTKHSIGSPS